MSSLRGEPTDDADLRPALVAVGVILGVGGVQYLALSPRPGGVGYRFAVELLFVPLPIVGTVVLSVLRDVQAVWRPLYVGTVFVGIYAVTDVLDEVVVQPDAVGVVFEDGALLVGILAILLGTVRWVHRQRTHEAELAARNERLDQFASVVTHDLRNPLNVAQMRLELAREGHGTEHLSTVADAHDRMEDLIEDVLQLARVGETVGETEVVGLASVAADAVSNTSLDAAALTVESDADLVADRERLVAVFENLFRNAVEHSSTGRQTYADGSGDGTASDVTVRVGLLYDGFFVEDDGPGIPPEERDRVFESGYTSDSDGTGLGLAIVEGVANAHGWSVSATNGDGGGARFEFRGVEFEGEVSTSAQRR